MIRVLEGDCRDVLPTLEARSVHCVVTSPPYLGLRDYQVAGQLGLEATPDEYIATMVGVFREVRRVLRDDGTLWLNMGDSYNANQGAGFDTHRDGGLRKAAAASPKVYTGLAPKQLLMMPARLALALQAEGWWLRSDIIWHKPNPMPESVTDRPTSAHEHVFLLSKQSRYFYDADAVREEPTGRTDPIGFRRWPEARDNANGYALDAMKGRNLRNVWTIATAPYAEAHFATFPPALAERCIKAGTSERGCCAACGAPWVRMQERVAADGRSVTVPAHQRHAVGDDGAPMMPDNRIDIGNRASFNATNGVLQRTTTGWAPQCQCDAGVVPCRVLDPFAGAGTTLLVADRLQRDAIGIELSPAYCAMLRNRVIADAPLLAEVAD